MLRFLGVDSQFTVWLNGTELGWSTGSRLTTEFAVGELLRPRPRTCSRCGCTSGRRQATSRTRTSGGCPGSSARSSSSPVRPGRSATTSCTPTTTTRRATGTLRVETDAPARLSVPELGLDDVDPAGPHTVAVEGWSGRTSPALRRHADRGRRDDRAAHRVPHGGDRRRPADRQRSAHPVPRREPARVESRPRPRGDARGHARRRAADEAAQPQRGAHEPLPAASVLPRAVRRVRAVGDPRERPRDARLRPGRLAQQSRATTRRGATRCSTA